MRISSLSKTALSGMLIIAVATSCSDKKGADVKSEPTAATNTTTAVSYLEDPRLDSGTKAFLKALNTSGGKPVESLDKEDARNVLTGAQNSVKVDLSGIEESEKTITQDGLVVKLTIVRPAGVKGKLPAFMFIHGGGWILGDYPTHKRLVRDLVVLSGKAAVFVNYTPSPEVHYPVAINEIYAATKWVAANGDQINVDGKKLAIAGNSVGGNMSAVTALMAKEKNGPQLKAQILLWPVTDDTFNWDSYKEFGRDRFLTEPLMKWMFDQYTTNDQERKSIYVSPLNATTEQLKGLPPALVVVAESDILRDQGEAFGRKLDEAGVKTTTIRYDGMIHDFGLLNPLAELPATRSAVEQAAGQLKKYLD